MIYEALKQKCIDIATFHRESCEGNIANIKMLVSEGYSVDSVYPYESEGFEMYTSTPLHWASQKGNILVVEYLIEQGANVNAKNKWLLLHFFLGLLFTGLLKMVI